VFAFVFVRPEVDLEELGGTEVDVAEGVSREGGWDVDAGAAAKVAATGWRRAEIRVLTTIGQSVEKALVE